MEPHEMRNIGTRHRPYTAMPDHHAITFSQEIFAAPIGEQSDTRSELFLAEFVPLWDEKAGCGNSRARALAESARVGETRVKPSSAGCRINAH